MANLDLDDSDLREALADLQHEIWSHWMRYLRTKGKYRTTSDSAKVFVLEPGNMEHWDLQMETSYADLSEKEKDSDREQADKILAGLREAAGEE
jgi:hypothetical protein